LAQKTEGGAADANSAQRTVNLAGRGGWPRWVREAPL